MPRHVRSRGSLPAFASIVSVAFVALASLPPVHPMQAFAESAAVEGDPQAYAHDGLAQPGVLRDDYQVSKLSTAPAVGAPDPGSAQAIAFEMVAARGWSHAEYECLVALWNRESHWNVFAHNTASGAYGIPQALPGDKMASAGADWASNPATQITWGLGYIAGRYGTPCGAWEHSENSGWY